MTTDRRSFLQLIGAGGALTLWPARSFAQAARDSDIAIVRDLLTTLHPGLYRYLSPRAAERGFAQLERAWTSDDRLEARYIALSRFLGSICCGHSYANFFNQRDMVKTALFDRPTRLPFTFRWIGDQMVVTGNQSGAAGRAPVWLPNASIIRAVDGVPVDRIYRRLRPFARVDGHNEGKARALLSVSGGESIEFFDVFHGLLFGAPTDGRFTIHYRAPGTRHDVLADMPALTLAERRAAMLSSDAGNGDDGEQWQWTMRDDGVAVLRMDSWGLFNSRWDWRTWLNARLDSLSGAKGLVVDIRENEGGLDCGDMILARLTNRPLPPRAERRLVRYRAVPDRLRPYLDTWDRRFYDWGDDATPVDDRYYLLRRDAGDEILAPATPQITVPVAILTTAQNSSATFSFAARAKAHGLATLIGETTGGNQRGINGGSFFFARLPQSGIEFDLPLIGYFPATPQPDGGIAPDIAIAPTVDSIASGIDVQLDRAVTHCLAQR
jgi:hypothetical protein